MRLFTALWPPPEVVDALARSRPDLPRGWRAIPPERWHVTLAFHGEDDPLLRARDLDERLAGVRAPRLRIAGTGTFPGVFWAGVETASFDDGADHGSVGPPDDGGAGGGAARGDRAELGDQALHALVAGAGGDPDGFVAHVTLARSRRRGRTPRVRLPPGPWWTPGEVLLVASERADGDLRYRPVHRVPLEP